MKRFLLEFIDFISIVFKWIYVINNNNQLIKRKRNEAFIPPGTEEKPRNNRINK